MFESLNKRINELQPDIIRPEDRALLPPDGYVPVLSDIVLPSILMALILIVLRHLFDRFIVLPFGAFFGLKENTSGEQTDSQPILEAEYRKCKSPNHDVIMGLSKKINMTEKQVQIWFRKRRTKDKASELKRLSDASWSFIFYALMSWYGLYVLWDKPWFTKSINCWVGWPAQTVSNDIYWYYLIELGFYISYLYMLFTDHKRKDFLEFLIHHSVTVALMILSWSINVVRIGSIVLVIHDQVDYILALAKTGIYIKKHRFADICFVIFIMTWIMTRLFIYPYVVLYTVYIELPAYADTRPHIQVYDRSVVGQLLKFLLVVLQILHIIWTILIIKSAAIKLTRGQLDDARSDTEEDDIEDFEMIEDNRDETISNGKSNNNEMI